MAEVRYGTKNLDSAIHTLDLEYAIKFLRRYPEFTQFVLDQSNYQFDIHTLVADASKMDLKEAVEDIVQDFAKNGTSSELCDANQSPLKHVETIGAILHSQSDAESTKVAKLADESTECDVLRNITNHPKNISKHNSGKIKIKTGSLPKHCVFCFNNGATREQYESHHCKDELGHVTCPVLQKYVCSRCNATGTNAHTAKYCPQKPIITLEDCVAIEHKMKQKRRCKLVEKNGTKQESKPIGETKTRSRLRC